jgi:hypothetical protein
LDIVFFSFFTRCPRKIINSTLLYFSSHSLSLYICLSLSSCIFSINT